MAAAGSASPSLTSSSHTLTAGSISMPPPPAASNLAAGAAAGAALLDSVSAQNRHAFLQPPVSIPSDSLLVVKNALDAFAGQVGDEQRLRLREAGKKRKREPGSLQGADVLKIRKVHVEGFETGQVWQQAKRIINGALRESQDVLRELQESGEIEGDDTSPWGKEASPAAPDEGELESESESYAPLLGSETSGDEDLDDELADGDISGSEISEKLEIDADGILEDEDEESGGEDSEDQPGGEFVQDPNGLNDEFFSIDEFNKQSQWFEEQDARADPNTDHLSDDEEINWHADPMAEPKEQSAKRPAKKSGSGENNIFDDVDEEDEDEDDDAGPTFGDMDLDAPEGESGDEADGELADGLDGGLDLTANDVFYKDFFAPPKKKTNKAGGGGKGRPLPKTQPPPPSPGEADTERAMNDVRRDLFDDLSERSDSEDALSDVSAGDPKSRRSAHERRQAKIAEEIRKLEAESVAKRAWTLSGEAVAGDRPINSLLEEDLDFEHAGKPVPVITQEVSESIEELIKRRILAGEFDEVIRRRPDALNDGPTRRGLVELDDTKAKQSLAEIYEEEHVQKANPDSYVSKADEKLRREEKEVERMWREVCADLDALSSWHYRPKPPAPSLTVVADVAAVSMEDAQPATAQGVVSGGESMMAPQEVYKAGGDTAERGEVVAKSGLPVARQEMSREEKLRRRRRDKERIRKGAEPGGRNGSKAAPRSKKAREQDETVSDLKKAGVRVINRRGEIVDMDGKKAAATGAPATSGSYKL